MAIIAETFAKHFLGQNFGRGFGRSFGRGFGRHVGFGLVRGLGLAPKPRFAWPIRGGETGMRTWEGTARRYQLILSPSGGGAGATARAD